MSGRKAFWKARRGLGWTLLALALGAEQIGAVPQGTTAHTVNAAAALIGGLTAFWGSVQAKQPLGLKDG